MFETIVETVKKLNYKYERPNHLLSGRIHIYQDGSGVYVLDEWIGDNFDETFIFEFFGMDDFLAKANIALERDEKSE